MRFTKILFVALLVAVLSSCTPGASNLDSVESGRDMKLILEERQIACESFDVLVSEETGSEILTCLDGTASQDAFFFLIWRTTEARDSGLEGFCFNLNRRGNAAFELIVQNTWVAYSESSFFPASALADELDASIVRGDDFCSSQGLEVAPILSEAGIEKCTALMELAEKFGRVRVTQFAIPYDFGDRVALNFGQYIDPSSDALRGLTAELRSAMRPLELDDDTPQPIREAVKDFPYSTVLDAATEFDNGTAPMYFFPVLDENLSGQAALDDLNSQVRLHNIRLRAFEAIVPIFNLRLLGVTSLCKEYAPFD